MINRYENFTVLISKINKNIKKIKNIEMAEYNLRSPHVSILYFLYVNESLTSKELCDKCEEDKGTISRSLDYLESNGFVNCFSKFTKRYNSPFILTKKGLEVGKIVAEKINAVLDEVNFCLSEEERIHFYIYLTKISNGLEEITKKNIDN